MILLDDVLVGVIALSFSQWCDTVSWVTKGHLLFENLCLISKGFFEKGGEGCVCVCEGKETKNCKFAWNTATKV